MKIAPCKGCADRQVGCHSACDKYKKFRSELDAENAEKQKIKDINAAYFAYQRSTSAAIKNYYRNKSATKKTK